MNTVATYIISNVEEENKRLNKVKIHQVYINYQSNALLNFSVELPSKLAN